MKFYSSVVKLMDSNSVTHGTGFILSDSGLIVTCTHVIEDLGIAESDKVNVMVPNSAFYSNDEEQTGFLLLQPVTYIFFEAVRIQEYCKPSDQEDISFLRLLDLPEKKAGTHIRYVNLFSSHILNYHQSYFAFGFPIEKNADGVPGKCTLTGETSENGFPVLSLNSDEITTGFSGSPVWDEKLQGVVGMVISILAPDANRKLGKTAFMIPIETLRACYPGLAPVITPPYVGLNYFSAAHAEHYFGRDKIIRELFLKLREHDLMMVVGVSGSGKSSLMRAGLAKGCKLFADEQWAQKRDFLTFNIGSYPIFSLLYEMSERDDGFMGLLAAKVGSESLGREKIISTAAELQVDELAQLITVYFRDRKTLLAIDQFERLFTLVGKKEQTEKMIQLIGSLASYQVKVIIVLRIEFYKEVLTHPILGKRIRNAKIDLLQMDENEIKEAIKSPALTAHLKMPDDLLNKLAYEYIDQAGSLPHLQFALNEIWLRDHQKGVMTISTYEELSAYRSSDGEVLTGAVGIIIKKAEEEIEKHINDIPLVRKIFLSLIAIKEGLDSTDNAYPDTSRRAFLKQFDPDTQRIAAYLSDSFLLTSDIDAFSGEPTIGVAHESLLQSWPRLKQWIVDYKPFLFWLNRDFNPYYEEWLRNAKGFRYLLKFEKTQNARKWLKNYGLEFHTAQKDFIIKSHRKNITLGTVMFLVVLTIFSLSFLYISQSLNSRKINARALSGQGNGLMGELNYNNAYDAFRKSLLLEDTSDTRQSLIEALSGRFSIGLDRKANGVIYDIGPDDRTGILINGKQAKLYDIISGSAYSLPVFQDTITRAKLSQDGKYAVLGLVNGDLKIWDLAAKRFIKGPANASHKSAISAIAISPARQIAYADEYRQVFVYDLASGIEKPYQLESNADDVWCLVFDKTSKWLYGGDAGGKVVSWEQIGNDWKRHTAIVTNDDVINAIDLSPDGKYVAAGGTDAVVAILSVHDGQIIRRMNGHGGAYTAVKFTADGSGIFSGGEDGIFAYWDFRLGQEWARWQNNETRIAAIHVTANGKEAVSLFLSGRVIKGQLMNNPIVKTFLTTQFTTIKVMAVSNDNKFLACASGDESGIIEIWDMSKQRMIATINAHQNEVIGLAFDSKNHYLASTGADKFCKIWENGSWKLVKSISCGAELNGLAADSAGNFVAGTSIVRPLRSNIIFISKYLKVDSIPFIGGSVFSMSTSSNGLITGGGDYTVKIYDLTNPKVAPVDSFAKHAGSVWAVALDAKAGKAASGSEDRTIRLYQIGADLKGSFLKTLYGHLGGIYGLAFSPGNNWLASGSNDQTVKLWNLDTYQPITLKSFHHPVYMIKFSHDGKRLYVCGLSNEIQVVDIEGMFKLWKVAPESWPK